MLLDKLVSILAPLCCLGCGVEAGRLVCEVCEEDREPVFSRCYRCKTATLGYSTCSDCSHRTTLDRVIVYARYKGLQKELVHAAKYERAKAGLTQIADHLEPMLTEYFDTDYLLVPAPTATSRVRQRGYDQAEVVARRLAVITGRVYSRLLARTGQSHQVGSTRKERFEHTKNIFRVRCPSEVNGLHIILVDDILTTGATLESAARELKKAGAKSVSALVYSQA